MPSLYIELFLNPLLKNVPGKISQFGYFVLSLKFGHVKLKGLHFEVISMLWPKSTMVDEACTVFKNSWPPLFFSGGLI